MKETEKKTFVKLDAMLRKNDTLVRALLSMVSVLYGLTKWTVMYTISTESIWIGICLLPPFLVGIDSKTNHLIIERPSDALKERVAAFSIKADGYNCYEKYISLLKHFPSKRILEKNLMIIYDYHAIKIKWSKKILQIILGGENNEYKFIEITNLYFIFIGPTRATVHVVQ